MTAIEVITGRVTNPGAAFTALGVNTADSFTTKSFPESSPAYLEGMWAQQATAGQVRVRSPRFHDDVQGIRKVSNAAAVRNLLADFHEQRVWPNDPLRFDMTGGGAEVDAAALLLYYRDLGGIAARVEMWESIKSRIEHYIGHIVAVAGPATSGDWSAGTSLTVTSTELKADRDYAVLGYEVDTESLAVALRGSDTGNLRIGGPGPLDARETRDWFVRLSQVHGTPHIPVINADNAASTLVFVARVGAGGTINVSFQMALLSR